MVTENIQRQALPRLKVQISSKIGAAHLCYGFKMRKKLRYPADFVADKDNKKLTGLALGIIWLIGAVGDRIWFALDHSVPAWDQADYLYIQNTNY